MLSSDFDKVTEAREVQLLNAEAPILVTLSGIIMFSSEVQPSNVELLINSIISGSRTEQSE